MLLIKQRQYLMQMLAKENDGEAKFFRPNRSSSNVSSSAREVANENWLEIRLRSGRQKTALQNYSIFPFYYVKWNQFVVGSILLFDSLKNLIILTFLLHKLWWSVMQKAILVIMCLFIVCLFSYCCYWSHVKFFWWEFGVFGAIANWRQR